MLAAIVVLAIYAGWASAPASSKPASATSAGCSVDEEAFFPREETVDLDAGVFCAPAASGVTYSGSVFATMAASLRLIGHLDFDGKDELSGVFDDVDLCSLPGGSDLPGAKLTYEAVVYVPGPTREFIRSITTESGRPLPPLLTGGSNPAHGTLVHAGQTISVHITATEPTNDGPQEGIHDIQLKGPDGLIKSQDYGTHPIACDTSRLSKTLTATYTVPDNPPAVITLTAIAHDFVGREATLSADFPTSANEWTGTFNLQRHSICPASEVGTVAFVVNGKGQVQGTTTGTYSDNENPCNDAPASGSGSFKGVVTGSASTKQFELTFYMLGVANEPPLPLPLTVPLTTPRSASGHGTDWRESSADGPSYRTYSVTLNRAS